MSEIAKKLKEQLLEWNVKFPHDRWYRKKYNIPFGSEVHRAANQFDIYMEWLEEEMFAEYLQLAKDEEKKKKEIKAGRWLKKNEDPDEDEEAALKLFDNLQVSNIKIED